MVESNVNLRGGRVETPLRPLAAPEAAQRKQTTPEKRHVTGRWRQRRHPAESIVHESDRSNSCACVAQSANLPAYPSANPSIETDDAVTNEAAETPVAGHVPQSPRSKRPASSPTRPMQRRRRPKTTPSSRRTPLRQRIHQGRCEIPSLLQLQRFKQDAIPTSHRRAERRIRKKKRQR